MHGLFGRQKPKWNYWSNQVMATAKRYSILCPKCHNHFPVFAALYHTIDIDQWVREKADAHDCKAFADMKAKAQEPKNTNPIKASKKGK